ncbi:MAG: hypothetical protein RIC89_16080 [Pseudomonadales bacterium]
MNWDALGAIAELLGAIAVLATLAYLAIQIRQNSHFIESSVYQSTNDAFIGWFSTMAADKTLADIWFNEIIQDKVTEEHTNQAKALLSVFFLALENSNHHQQKGVVNRATLTLPGFAQLFRRKFVSDWLERDGVSALTPEFLAMIRGIQQQAK